MGKAFLALWNDFAPELTEEYEAWHSFEHVPERLIPRGVRTARRYAAFERTENRYFTLYELDDIEALQDPAYLDLVDNPTEWSARMRRYFSNVLRVPADCVAAGGHGIGGAISVHAFSAARVRLPAALPALAAEMHRLVSEGHILGFRIGIAEPNQPYKVFVQADETDPDTQNVVLLIEGATRKCLQAIDETVIKRATEQLSPRSCLRSDSFDLLVSYADHEFPALRSALKASPALRSRFPEQS